MHVPTCGGIARFVMVSQRFCAFGKIAWGPQTSPHEPFFGIVRFVVVFGAIFGAFLRFIGFALI